MRNLSPHTSQITVPIFRNPSSAAPPPAFRATYDGMTLIPGSPRLKCTAVSGPNGGARDYRAWCGLSSCWAVPSHLFAIPAACSQSHEANLGTAVLFRIQTFNFKVIVLCTEQLVNGTSFIVNRHPRPVLSIADRALRKAHPSPLHPTRAPLRRVFPVKT